MNTDPMKQIENVSNNLLLVMAESSLTPLRELVGWSPTLYGWVEADITPFHHLRVLLIAVYNQLGLFSSLKNRTISSAVSWNHSNGSVKSYSSLWISDVMLRDSTTYGD